jgi:hypothetical protein
MRLLAIRLQGRTVAMATQALDPASMLVQQSIPGLQRSQWC